MRHPNLDKWEKKLKAIFDEIDDYLEEKYGNLYSLHPARAKKGTTSNKEHDGLFNVGASFSAGIGSEYGPGYVVEIHMATLSQVDEEVRKQIEEDVIRLLNMKLVKRYPDRPLDVAKDGNVFKIYGNLNLGKL